MSVSIEWEGYPMLELNKTNPLYNIKVGYMQRHVVKQKNLKYFTAVLDCMCGD